MGRYNLRGRQSRRISIFSKLTLLLMVIASVVVFVIYGKTNSPVQVAEQSNVDQQPQATPVQTLISKILINGTVTWSRGVSQQAGSSFDQPFSRLGEFGRSDYDAWTANLECPITNKRVSFESEYSNLLFNCHPDFLPSARKYFDIFNLANNHTYDQAGSNGLEETRQHLAASGAQYFGSYDSSDSSDVCEVVSLPAHVSGDGSVRQLPVAFCGWHYFTRQPQQAELEIMNQYVGRMPVFAFVEAGVEYRSEPDERQKYTAHKLIDMGADFVFVNSPHWVQPAEAYQGKLIVYSMGNFIFDQLDTETNRSASYSITTSVDIDDNVQGWLNLNCQTHGDDCLQKSKELSLTKIKPSYTVGVVAGQNGYRNITHPADSSVSQQVIERTHWQQTCTELETAKCQ